MGPNNGCQCAVCSHAPDTVRRSRRCKAAGTYLADVHTAAHVDLPLKLLPARPGAGSAPDSGEPQAEVPLQRLGTELRTAAICLVLLLLASRAWAAKGADWAAQAASWAGEAMERLRSR